MLESLLLFLPSACVCVGHGHWISVEELQDNMTFGMVSDAVKASVLASSEIPWLISPCPLGHFVLLSNLSSICKALSSLDSNNHCIHSRHG